MAAEVYVEYLAQPEDRPPWRPAGWWAYCQRCAYESGPYPDQGVTTAVDRHVRTYHGGDA